jgi:short-subunit dehydrogenase
VNEFVKIDHIHTINPYLKGIGKEMARLLSGYNPKRLILTARNKEKGNNLLEYIKTSNGNVKNVEIWEMDLSDLQSVKNFANKFIREVGELHMLFNNAGFVAGLEIVKTKDGLEQQFQVIYNYGIVIYISCTVLIYIHYFRSII